MKKDPERRLPLSVMPDSRIDEETTRKRAYELYVERGMEDGHDLEDCSLPNNSSSARNHPS